MNILPLPIHRPVIANYLPSNSKPMVARFSHQTSPIRLANRIKRKALALHQKQAQPRIIQNGLLGKRILTWPRLTWLNQDQLGESLGAWLGPKSRQLTLSLVPAPTTLLRVMLKRNQTMTSKLPQVRGAAPLLKPFHLSAHANN